MNEAELSAAEPPGRGDKQPKYRAIAELGEGGMANVYLAVARGPVGFNKLVVLKTLKRNLASDVHFRRMFLNEARLAARLNHQNIVQTYEVFEDRGIPVLVMEYLEGQSLSNLSLRARELGAPLSCAVHLRILSDVLIGLHYSHELLDYDGTPLNVVHRDVTPHNVFVTFDGQVKVLDFGIAKLGNSPAESRGRSIKGKIRYLPPEQIATEPVDRRADVYSVGIVLWEALTSRKMWDAVPEPSIIRAVLAGDIPNPRRFSPELPQELERICMKALAHNKQDRYRTALEFHADLDRFQRASAPIDGRDIAQCAIALFAEARAQTRAIIEQALADVRLEHSDASEEALIRHSERMLSLAPRSLLGSGALQTSDATESVAHILAPTSRAHSKHWKRAQLGLLAFLTLVAITVALRRPEPSNSQVSAPLEHAVHAPSSALRGAAGGEATPALVSLNVVVAPARARVFLDNRELASNPFSDLVPASTARHTIHAEAPGYVTESSEIRLDHSVNVALTLKPVSSEDEAKPERARPLVQRPVKRAQSSQSSATSPENCSPPYVVDEQGIKEFKAECL